MKVSFTLASGRMEIIMDGLMKSIGYVFKDENLLRTALTHSSYANEHNEKSYERLEFLGDSILSFVISTYLFENHPELPEGEMSKIRAAIVCERSLETSCRKIGVEKHIILSRGEEITGGRERSSIIADVFEAIYFNFNGANIILISVVQMQFVMLLFHLHR